MKLTKALEKRMELQRKKLYVDVLTERLPSQNDALNRVFYTKDGHVEILNSSVAVRVSDVHENNQEDPEFSKNLDKIMTLPEVHQKIIIPTNIIEDKIKELAITDNAKLLTMTLYGDRLIIKSRLDTNNSYSREIKIYRSFDVTTPITVNLDPRLFHDMLNFYRMLKIKEVTFMYEGPHEPYRFIKDNIQYIIAPIRLN